MQLRPPRAGAILSLIVATAVLGLRSAQAAAEVQVSVDPAKAGPAISPYIFGQFIEHLGRCIRDGIWAEKLRDRKMLLEPGKSWQVVKAQGAEADVLHDPAGAYCGEHATAVWVRKGGKCGVRQTGIGLLAGKEYVGYAILARAGAAVPVEVRIAWGSGEGDGQSFVFDNVTSTHQRHAFRFRAAKTTDAAELSITLASPGYVWIGCASLMPADHVRGMRADTLELIRQLNSPIYRWPGGNFVSGYRWTDAIGDRDRRPPRWERAWNDVEDNDFGIDEFLDFCREVGTEPLVVVNTGLGSIAEAAAEVEYANGPANSRWGAERVRNGHREPYRVAWWGIGNEMYGNWQLGNVPVARYSLRHNAYVAAMKAVDPQIKTVAVGSAGRWNDAFLPGSAGHFDLLSMHHYSERKLRVPFSAEDARKYQEQFPKYSDTIAAGVRGLIDDIRRRQTGKSPAIDRVRLCIDEWGLVRDWNAEPDGPGVGAFEHYYPLGDALAVGRALHELLRAADVVGMANWPQTVNVIGAIKTTRNHAAMDSVGHLLALYRARVKGRMLPLAVEGAATLDAVAAQDASSRTISLGLINYSPSEPVTVKLRIAGSAAGSAASGWRIAGASLAALNIPGQPEAVTTTRLADPVPLGQPLALPPHSITVLEFNQP